MLLDRLEKLLDEEYDGSKLVLSYSKEITINNKWIASMSDAILQKGIELDKIPPSKAIDRETIVQIRTEYSTMLDWYANR